MYAIKVQSGFNAAHNLRGYQGKCERLHGHNWKVQVRLDSARLDNLAMVCDFKEVKKKLNKVLNGLDHTYLNRLAYFKKNNPTSEKIAEFIFHRLQKSIKGKNLILQSVVVWETESACAVFSEEENA